MANTTVGNRELFQITPAPSVLGLARLAAEAERFGDGHRVEFRLMQCRSILNKTNSRRGLDLAYGINPYRGCEFGCRYCYARYTHTFLGTREQVPGRPDFADPEMFERLIFLKENAAWLLEQELRKVNPADEIAIGTATDPYQPVERTAKITRSLLEVFARKRGYRVGLVTKSKMILRDIDVLTEIAKHNRLVLHLTITTQDTELARLLEPRAPRPDLRFEAVHTLRSAGLTAGILCSPLLPGITDSEGDIDGMVQRAAGVGTSFFAAEPLFLKSCSRPTYLSFVREHFPHLEADYARRFFDRDFADGPYRRELAARVQRACTKFGVNRRSTDGLLTTDVGLGRKVMGAAAYPMQTTLFA